MTMAEYDRYWVPVREKFHQELRSNDELEGPSGAFFDIHSKNVKLSKLLGVKYPFYEAGEPAPPELISCLKALLGPHGHTLMKMKKIQNGIIK